MDKSSVILPDSRIGILGGGQLGKMSAMAAANLGYRTQIWCQSREEPAAQAAPDVILGDWSNKSTLAKFLSMTDVITYEFENVPVELAEEIQRARPLHPSSTILGFSQDRWLEKTWLTKRGIPIVPTELIEKRSDLRNYVGFTGLSILKTRRMGYDGKGQHVVRSFTELESAWVKLGSMPCILENYQDFAYEISVIVARNLKGQVKIFTPIQNEHRNGILAISHCPGPKVTVRVAKKARALAVDIAQKSKLVGLITIEMFVLKDGSLIVNEIAPRPHNSGHGTREGCLTDQFEQHIRAICNLPLGSTKILTPWRMENLIGSDIERVPQLLTESTAVVTIYGKNERREGRKMGHVTFLEA